MPTVAEYSGGGDPDRILPLLWRRLRPVARDHPPLGRKPRLTLDAVVSAAIALADVDGLVGVSMNRVAAALRVGAMTLYTYVRSKAELIDLMVDEVLAERTLPTPGEHRPPAWRAQVGLYADRTRAMYRRHPWLCHVSTVRPPIGPGMLAEREYVLSTLTGTGLTLRQINAAALAITAVVTATASLEAQSEQLERSTGQSNDAWWQERTRLWEEYFDVDAHPTMTHLWNHGGFHGSTAEAMRVVHEFGFERLLDGIDALVAGNGRA